jgi:hypothetical protein
MTEQIHRAKINKSNYRTNTICSVIWLVYLRSVYLFCHLTCLSSFRVFVLSFDLFIFTLCICSVIWPVYLRFVYLFCNLTLTEQIQRTKINKSNCRTNTQSEDKQVKLQNKYTERYRIPWASSCIKKTLIIFQWLLFGLILVKRWPDLNKLSIDPWNMFCTNLNNHVPLMIPVNYCTSIDSSQKYLVYSIETHIKI